MSYQPISNPMPVSGTVTANISGTVPVSGTFWQATQPVSIASMPSTPVTGTFWQSTQPVSIAATVAISAVSLPLPAGAATAAKQPALGTAGTASTDVITVQGIASGVAQPVSIATMPSTPVTGTFWQATQPVSGTITVGNASLAVTGTFWQATQPVSIASAVSVTQATLTKGTQGATGVSTQDLKDAGRAIVNAATAIGGVTGVTTEALLSLNVSRDGAATAAATTIAVTSGKRYRITGLVASARSTAATVFSARVALRMNPSGAAVATSPILAIASMTQQAAALAEAGDTCVIPFPDGIEISGTMQVGLSQVCSGTGGVVYASLIGYEY